MNTTTLISIQNKIRKHQLLALTPIQLIILTCVYIGVVCNLPFLIRTSEAIISLSEFNVLFLASVPILLCCLLILVNSLTAIGKLLKPILIFNLFISSLLFYATSTYGIVFDYTMIQNGLETDSAEALSYVNWYSIAFLLFIGVLPITLVVVVKVKKQTVLTSFAQRFGLISACIAIIILIASGFYSNYAAVGRNNPHLLAYITPYKFFDAGVKYVNKRYLSPQLPFQMLDNMPLITQMDGATHVTVLVLGETARAQNFSLNGYTHDTNQYTKNTGIVSFSKVSSCGTATAVSVPCMFSRLNRSDYENKLANSQQNLLDIASIAGMDVLWIDNNNGSCKGVCARVNTIKIEPDSANPLCDGEYCLDEMLLAPLKTKLSTLRSKHTLIVLHMMGSHGPTYFRRYTQDKRRFLPDCQRSDIQNCSKEEIVNTYDNTIVYTDFVLNEVIEILKDAEANLDIQASMLYISDHGESLGEKGVFLHGFPYAFAPEEQTHVPMLYWQTHNTHQTNISCLNSQRSKTLSHDNFFDIVLGVASIDSSVYQANNDLFSQCRDTQNSIAVSAPLQTLRSTSGNAF